MQNEKGEVEKLSEEDQKKLETEVIDRLASEGLRTIGIAYREFVPFDAHTHQVRWTSRQGHLLKTNI